MKNGTLPYKVRKDLDGNIIKLKLVKIKDYEKFTLYQVVKVINDKEEIPLYKETFTPEQYNDFYELPAWYEAV